MDFLHSLSTKQIDGVRSLFKGVSERLDVERFVFGAAAVLGLGSASAADPDTISKLMELFQRADRDGLGAITWSDFNTVFVAGDPADVAAAKQSHSEGFELVVREAASRELLRSVPGGLRHAHTIRHMSPLPLWAVLFTDSPTVALFRSVWKPGVLSARQLRLVAVMHAEAPVLDIWYHGTAQAIVLTASNFALEVWDAKALLLALETMDSHHADLVEGSGVWKAATATSAPDVPLLTMTPGVHRAHYQHCFVPEFRMCHVPEASKLITTSSGGQVHVWHMHIARPDGKLAVLLAFRGELLLHKGPVKQMALLSNVGLVATAGIDGVVALWAVRGLADGRGGRRGVMDTSEAGDAMAALLGRTFAASAAGTGGPTSAETVADAALSARAAKELAPVSGVSLHGTLRPHSRAVTCLLYLHSSKLLVSGSHDASITVTDMLPKEDGGYKAYKLLGHHASIVALERLDSVKQTTVGAVEIDMMDGGGSGGVGGLAAEPMGGTSYKASQFVSLDASFELRWWNASRNADTEGMGRCQQVLSLSPYGLARPSGHAMALLNVRMTSYDPDVAANPLSFAGDAASSLLTNAAMVGSADAVRAALEGGGGGGSGGGDGSPLRGRGATTAAPPSDNAQLPVFVAFGSQPRVVEARAFADRKIHVQNLLYHALSSRLLLFATGEVLTYDVHTGELLTVAKPLREETTPGAAAWLSGGRRLAVGCRNGQVHVLDPNAVSVMRTLQRHAGGEVVGVGSFPRDALVLTLDEAGDVLVHDEAAHVRMERSEEGLLMPPATRAARCLVRRLRRANGRAVVHRCLAVCAPALLFATGDANGGVRVWDAATFALVAELAGHDVEVTAMAWAGDHRTLVTSDRRGVCHAWAVTRAGGAACLATWALVAGQGVRLTLPWPEASHEAATAGGLASGDPALMAARAHRRMSDVRLEEMWRANSTASVGSGRGRVSGAASRVGTPVGATRASRASLPGGSGAVKVASPPPCAVTPSTRPSRRDSLLARAHEGSLDDGMVISESGVQVEHLAFLPAPVREPVALASSARGPLPAADSPAQREYLASVDVDGCMTLVDLAAATAGPEGRCPPPQAVAYLPLIMHRRCRVDGAAATARPLVGDARALVTADTALTFDEGTDEDALWLLGDDEGEDRGGGAGGSVAADAAPDAQPCFPTPRSVLAGRRVRVVHHMHGGTLPALGSSCRTTLPSVMGAGGSQRRAGGPPLLSSLPGASLTWQRTHDDWGEGAAAAFATTPDCTAVFMAAPDKLLHAFRVWPKTAGGDAGAPLPLAPALVPYGCVVTVAGKVPDAGGMGVAAGGGARRLLEQNHWVDPVDVPLRAAALHAQAQGLARAAAAKAGAPRPTSLLSYRSTADAVSRSEAAGPSPRGGSPRLLRTHALPPAGLAAILADHRPAAVSVKPAHPLLRALARHAAEEFGVLDAESPASGIPRAASDTLSPIAPRGGKSEGEGGGKLPPVSAFVQAATRPMTAAGKDALFARLAGASPLRAAGVAGALLPDAARSPAASPPRPSSRAAASGERLARMLGAFDRVGVSGGELDPVWHEATCRRSGEPSPTAADAASPSTAAPQPRMSLASLLLVRNPRLFNRLRRIYELKARGVQYRSMDKEEIHQRAIGVYAARQEEQRRRAAAEDERNEERLARTLTLGLIAQLVQQAPADGGGDGGAGGDGAAAAAVPKPAVPTVATGFHLVGSAHEAAAAKMVAAGPRVTLGRVTWESMDPERYLEASQATRIGSERRRDVDSFAHLCRFADPDRTGRIQWSLLVEELNKADSSLSFLRGQMEALFRNADVHDGGVLSVHDFARALFPRADPATIRDVVGYAYYSGPNLEQVRQRFLHHNAAALRTLRDIFDMIDADHSGTVDAAELDSIMRGVMAGQQRVAAAVVSASGGAGGGGGCGGGGGGGVGEDGAGEGDGADGGEGAEYSFTRAIGLDPGAVVTFEQFVTLVGPHVIDT